MAKVLQITGTLERGGLETFVMNVYRASQGSDIQFEFLTQRENGAYEPEILSNGDTIYHIPARNQGVAKYYQALDKFFAEHAHEYVACHMHVSTLSSIEALYFAKKHGIKVRVLHSHSSSVSGSKIHYITHTLMKPFVHSWATHYLGCSEKANKWLYAFTGVLDKARMIKNGINVQKYKYSIADREAIRKEFNLKEEVLLGHVGRFIWVKNHKFIVEVFEEFHKLEPQSKLILVGEGTLEQEIREIVIQKGLEIEVIFAGVRSDINRIVQGLDVFVMPSFYEGLPVSLVEAQASGVLVVGSDTISTDTKITDCMHFLSLEKNAKEWAKTIHDLLASHQRRDTSADITIAGFDIDDTAHILRNIYIGNE